VIQEEGKAPDKGAKVAQPKSEQRFITGEDPPQMHVFSVLSLLLKSEFCCFLKQED